MINEERSLITKINYRKYHFLDNTFSSNFKAFTDSDWEQIEDKETIIVCQILLWTESKKRG